MSQTISVIIPAYNEEKYIRPSLASLVELQNKSSIPLEIVVCDNGSTDSTPQIVSEFPTVKLVYETNLRGANAARQKAFQESTGAFVAAMDADCIPEQNWIENALAYFENPKVVSVAGVYTYENTFKGAEMINSLQRTLLAFVHMILHRVFGKGGIMVGGNAWYRRSALESIGGFETSIPFWGDDAHTASKLAKLGRLVFAPNVRVITSSRRFTTLGPWKAQWLYTANYISIVLRGKPYSKTVDEDVIR